MAVKLKLAALFDPRDERLPKKTGIGGKLKPFRKQALFDPQKTIRAKPAVQAQLAPYRAANPKQVRQAFAERLALAVDNINRHIEQSTQFKGLRFSVDQASRRNVATVRDIRTGEVLREIPPEGVLQIAANLRSLAGILDNKEG